MIGVLDTSAAAAVVFNQKKSASIMEILSSAEFVLAPEIYIPEITNVCWKYFQFENVPLSLCEKALKTALNFVDEIVSSKELCLEAFSMSCLTKMSSYDMFFLILARRNNAELITVNEKLANVAKKHDVRLAVV